MKRNFLTLEQIGADFASYAEDIRRGTPTAVFGVSDAFKYLLAGLSPVPVVYVTADSISARKAAEDIAAYIDEHLSERIFFADIMNRFHLSKSALYELFRRNFNTTVHSYIQSKRLEHAAAALTESDEPVADIAARFGIADQNYFSRIFKQTYGMSPLAYRHLHASASPGAVSKEKSASHLKAAKRSYKSLSDLKRSL